MPVHAFTAAEAAQQVGVEAAILRTWSVRLGIPGQRTKIGERMYSTQDLAQFEAIKGLREQDAGFETIRRVIGQPLEAEEVPRPSPEIGSKVVATPDAPIAMDEADASEVATVVTRQVAAILRHETEVAIRYARAAHQIGTLEERVRALEAQLFDAWDEVRTLKGAIPRRSRWKFWRA